MIRKLLCGLCAAVTLTFPAQAVRSVPVQVDGTVLDAPARVENGVSYVPLRSLLDAFGGWSVDWNRQTNQAEAVSDTHCLTANPNQNTVTVNGASYAGGVFVLEGRTYIPLRVVAEALGGQAEWDPYLDGPAVTSAGADYSAIDLYWLSRVISAESRGEPIEGQIAVGNVVLNRVESADFPDSIPQVIFQVDGAYQFEPVENQTIYQEPTELSIEAARRVLDGESTIGDALFFYAPALSQGAWINDNRTYLDTIGCHRFYQ